MVEHMDEARPRLNEKEHIPSGSGFNVRTRLSKPKDATIRLAGADYRRREGVPLNVETTEDEKEHAFGADAFELHEIDGASPSPRSGASRDAKSALLGRGAHRDRDGEGKTEKKRHIADGVDAKKLDIISYLSAASFLLITALAALGVTSMANAEPADSASETVFAAKDGGYVLDAMRDGVADGYGDPVAHARDLEALKDSADGMLASALEEYDGFVTEEMKSAMEIAIADIKSAATIGECKGAFETFSQQLCAVAQAKAEYEAEQEAKRKAEEEEAARLATFEGKERSGSGLTKSAGVNYYNGHKETYYSSNVLYHYRTPEWVCDDEGFWRTTDGYYVVAANSGEYSQGTIIDTSKGKAMVLDSGCSYGTIDFYVNW